MLSVEHREYLSLIGMRGGQEKTAKKIKAARKNAAKARAAIEPLYPPCPDYHAHTWDSKGRCYGRQCKKRYPDLRRLSKAEAKQLREERKKIRNTA